MRVIACAGYSATLRIGKRTIALSQFEPVNLTLYTKKELRESNLQTLFDAGWVEEYTNQTLPEKPKGTIDISIPTVKQVVRSGNKDTQVHIKQRQEGKRIHTDVDLPENFVEEMSQRTAADKKAREEEARKIVDHVGVSSESDKIRVQKVTPEELQVGTTLVDGHAVKNYKFAQKPKNKAIENIQAEERKEK